MFKGQLAKCLIVVFIGPPSLKMRGRSAALVSSVREQEIHLHGDNKCLTNLCYSVRYLGQFCVHVRLCMFFFEL